MQDMQWYKGLSSANKIALWGVIVAAAGVLIPLFYQILSSIMADNGNAQALAAIKEHAQKDPPYYGNSWNGNVRPQMETYLNGFLSIDALCVRALTERALGLIEDKKNEEFPKDYFNADNEFRAAMDELRTTANSYAITGEYPST